MLRVFAILAVAFLFGLSGCASKIHPQLMSDLELSRIRAGIVSKNIGAAPTFSICGSTFCVAAVPLSETQTVRLTQTFKSPTRSIIRARGVSKNLYSLFGVKAPFAASFFEVIGAAPTFSSCGSTSCFAAVSLSQTQTVRLTQTFKSATTSVSQETSVSLTPIDTFVYTPASAWWQRQQDYLLRPKF